MVIHWNCVLWRILFQARKNRYWIFIYTRIKFPDFFHMGTFIGCSHVKLWPPSKYSPSTAMHLLYRSNNVWKAPWKSSCVSVSMIFVTASFISSIVSWRKPLSLGNNQKSQGASLDYREGDELSWCPSLLNCLWQGWSCGLVHCPDRNSTDPIWRVLASSHGISSWPPLIPQPQP